jgi:hypothetical protein
MQKFGFDSDKIREELVYQGVTFTLVIITYNNGDNKPPILAEGVSRRSILDKFDPELGHSIATGRALKALKKKLLHEPIRHHFMG